jgi:hypothetical protein
MAGRDVRQSWLDGWEVSYSVMGEVSEVTGQTVLGAPLEVGDLISEAVLTAT